MGWVTIVIYNSVYSVIIALLSFKIYLILASIVMKSCFSFWMTRRFAKEKPCVVKNKYCCSLCSVELLLLKSRKEGDNLL